VNDQVAVILIFVFAILGPCLIIAATGYASISALGRNPSAAPKIFTAMIMMVMFGAAISVVSLLVLFQIYVPTK
jgi:F0F1-type ATP synthase membrane subunit c/vacuolar-type H+-ATPase subunit K